MARCRVYDPGVAEPDGALQQAILNLVGGKLSSEGTLWVQVMPFEAETWPPERRQLTGQVVLSVPARGDGERLGEAAAVWREGLRTGDMEVPGYVVSEANDQRPSTRSTRSWDACTRSPCTSRPSPNRTRPTRALHKTRLARETLCRAGSRCSARAFGPRSGYSAATSPSAGAKRSSSASQSSGSSALIT
jgi:hypothetical protein